MLVTKKVSGEEDLNFKNQSKKKTNLSRYFQNIKFSFEPI